MSLENLSIKELEEKCIEFNKRYNLSQQINYTFRQQFEKILEQNNTITAKRFSELTGYDVNRFYRMKRGEPTSMKTFITFCIAFQIDIMNAVEMLKSLGVAFNPTDKTHVAYCYLLSDCMGKTIIDCNEILRKLEVTDTLGDFS